MHAKIHAFRVSLILFALSLTGLAGLGCGSDTVVTPADTIYYNASFITMNDEQATAEAVAVTNGKIVAVGSKDDVFEYSGLQTATVDLQGAFVFPGFIDSHSHTMGYAFFFDPDKWVDVSNMNLYFKPAPSDPRCTDPTNPQVCFLPATSQDEVLDRIAAKVQELDQKDPSGTKPVLGFGYAGGRLGPTATCQDTGFACPNFQGSNPDARQALDAISTTRPIAIAASTGHFLFVNTMALGMVNICGADGSDAGTCHTPAYNPAEEVDFANTGVLIEDLALYGTGVFQQGILKEDPFSTFTLLKKAINIYAQHGFTTVQEGAAEGFQIDVYDIITRDPEFPVSVALLAYTGSTQFQDAVTTANKASDLSENNPNMFVAGIKTFADGSIPDYTGALTQPYFEIFPPLPAGWTGVVDLDEAALSSQIAMAHAAGYPIAIHMNGDAGVDNALAAMQANHDPNITDIAIHLQLSDEQDFETVKAVGAQATFLIPNLYYMGLSFCQQVIGAERTVENVSPIGDALNAGIPIRLHSDSPVTPPDPLFMIWTAVTRQVQQPSWLPNADPNQCPKVMNPDQQITIAEGIQAFTVDSASLYGLQDEIGMLKTGLNADMVLLSDNPLNMESNPDDLANIQILGTIHHGKQFANPNAGQTPIWPD